MTNPKIILYAQSQIWVLKTEQGEWLVPILADATTLAGFIPSEVSHTTRHDLELETEGRAYFYNSNKKTCLIDLISKQDSIPPVRITLDYCLDHISDSGTIRFIDGFDHDSWVATEANAILNDISSLGFLISIPIEEGFGSKTIAFEIEGQRALEYELTRGEKHIIWLDIPESDEWQHELKIYSSSAEPFTHDERSLGFNLIELNINLTQWELYGVIYNENPAD